MASTRGVGGRSWVMQRMKEMTARNAPGNGGNCISAMTRPVGWLVARNLEGRRSRLPVVSGIRWSPPTPPSLSPSGFSIRIPAPLSKRAGTFQFFASLVQGVDLPRPSGRLGLPRHRCRAWDPISLARGHPTSRPQRSRGQRSRLTTCPETHPVERLRPNPGGTFHAGPLSFAPGPIHLPARDFLSRPMGQSIPAPKSVVFTICLASGRPSKASSGHQ